jgi:threonine synthase
MKYYSTNNKQLKVGFEEAVRTGLPEDRGLFMPEEIPRLSDSFFSRLSSMSLGEIGHEILSPFIGKEISEDTLGSICNDAFSFPLRLVELNSKVYSLELYHGPTLAFKDFGARFMARILGHFNSLQGHKERTTILVATSGDTGSAVAAGFYNVPNLDVVILYPNGKVSDLQEKQMTTLGGNVNAIAINGTFDDCQRLVKKAFTDREFKESYGLTSANSINIARLLPQMLYYFYAYAQLADSEKEIVFSVPSGNYGNLSAGVIAKKMGLPIAHFVAASNANEIVPHYLKTGFFEPKPSIETISNAMDVGDPSNFARLRDLFNDSHNDFSDEISGISFSDTQTRELISEGKKKFNYTLDPHGAIGYGALCEYLKENNSKGAFLETAHPIKFREEVEPIINEQLEIPESLVEALGKEPNSYNCSSNYSAFKKLLETILEY